MRTYNKEVPCLGAYESEIVAYANKICNYNSTIRKHYMKRMCRNLYYYKGWHWLTDQGMAAGDTNGNFFYRFFSKDDWDGPTPTTNHIAVACDNEHARISKKEWTFKVIATDASPKVRAAAQLGQHVLRNKLKRQNWEEKRDRAVLDGVVCGTAGMHSAWDSSIIKMTWEAVPDARQCKACGAVLSSMDVPVDFKESIKVTDSIESISEEAVKLKACPQCGAEVGEYTIIPDRDVNLQDVYGRQFGVQVPSGEPVVDVMSPFDIYPENAGISTDPWNFRSIGWMRPVDMYWIRERYPERADDITAQPPQEIFKVHPLYGEIAANYGQPGLSPEDGIFDNHVLLKEVIVLPFVEKVTEESIRLADEAMQKTGRQDYDLKGAQPGEWLVNRGRYYLCAGDKLVSEGPLLIEYTDHKGQSQFMPKVAYGISRYKTSLGEFWGMGIPDDGISLNNRINTIDAQSLDATSRMASPNIIAADDLDIRGPEWDNETGPSAGKRLTYTRSVLAPQDKPEVLEGHAIHPSVWSVRDRWLADLQTVCNVKDIEQGDVPPNLRTTSGLVLTGENAAARRNPRERALSFMFESVAKHQLMMLYALRTEYDTYQVDAKGASSTAIKYFRGADLQAQYNVEVDKEAGVDQNIYTREAAWEGLRTGVYDISDPIAKNKFMKIAGLPEIDDTGNVQVKKAEEVAIEFVEQGKIHRPEPTVEDAWVFHQLLGQFWLENEKIKSMQEIAKFNDDILPLIANWEEELLELEMKDSAARQFYGRYSDPGQARQTFDAAVDAEKMATEQYRVESQASIDAGVMPAPFVPPFVPPEPIFAPYALEDKIRLIWNQRLGLEVKDPGFELQLTGTPKVVDNLLNFSAVIQAYRIYAERKKMAAMGGPVVASPGGPQAPGGVEPTPGSPAQMPPSSQGAVGVQMPTGRIGGGKGT